MKAAKLPLLFLVILFLFGCGSDSEKPTTSVPDPTTQIMSPETEIEMSAKINELSGSEGLDATNPAAIYDTNFDYYAVVFVWGTLRPTNILGGPIIDWSGNLNFNGVGDIAPVHPIHFEPVTDAILPDTFPGFVEWKSSTLLEFDGIAGIVSHDKRIVYFAPPRLQFTTQLFSIELGFDKLERYFAVFPTDSNTAVAVMAHRIRKNVCRHGNFRGLWMYEDNSRVNGAMHGIWFNDIGDSVGRYDGRFWTDENFERQFEGTISGLVTDDIKGHFRGKWWFDDPRMCPAPECGTGHGRFVGKLAYLNSGNVGDISGEFGDMSDATEQPMHGVWRLFCREYDATGPQQEMQ